MNLYEEDLFEVFKREIIQHKEDTRNQRWKYKCEQVANNIENHDINLLSPKDCVLQVASQEKPDVDIIQTLEQLENAFYCLSQYAINLCRDPYRKEYSLIKTYNGYYACNILSVMNGTDMNIIKSMGYQIKDGSENNDECILRSPAQNIHRLAFELFLAQPYCQYIKKSCMKVRSNYPKEAILSLLECDIKKIVKYGAEKICEKWMSENKHKYSDSSKSYTCLNIDNITSDEAFLSIASSFETTNLDHVNTHDLNPEYTRENPLYKSAGRHDYATVTKMSSNHRTKVLDEENWVSSVDSNFVQVHKVDKGPPLPEKNSSISLNDNSRISDNRTTTRTTFPADFMPKAYNQ